MALALEPLPSLHKWVNSVVSCSMAAQSSVTCPFNGPEKKYSKIQILVSVG